MRLQSKLELTCLSSVDVYSARAASSFISVVLSRIRGERTSACIPGSHGFVEDYGIHRCVVPELSTLTMVCYPTKTDTLENNSPGNQA